MIRSKTNKTRRDISARISPHQQKLIQNVADYQRIQACQALAERLWLKSHINLYLKVIFTTL